MASKDEKLRVVNTAGESAPPESSTEEPELQGTLNGNQNDNKDGTSSNNLGKSSTDENTKKVNNFEEWFKTYQSIIESIKEERKQDKTIGENDIILLKKQLIAVEEMFDSLLEGFNIQTRIKEAEDAIKQLESRLKKSDEGSKMPRMSVSALQDSVLEQFDNMYAEVSDTSLCKIHKDCYEFCKKRFMDQMKMFCRAAKPLTLRQSDEQPNDDASGDASGETQVLESVYRELARDRVEIELQHIKNGWSKEKKHKNLGNRYEDCLKISWIMLILDQPMLIEFEYEVEKKGMFVCKVTEDETPIVLKPAVLLNKENVIRVGEVCCKNTTVLKFV